MAKGRYGDGLSWRAARAERLADEAALALRLRAATFRLATARLRSLLHKANFDPSQPRVPPGQPGGGRWTDGGPGTGRPSRRPVGEPVRLVQARGGRAPLPPIRLPRGLVEPSPLQAMRYEAARIRAEMEMARLRAVPGNENWKPPDGLYETVEGAIRQQEAVGDAAIAYRYGRSALPSSVAPRGIGDNSGDPRPLPDRPVQSLRRGDAQPFTPGTLRTFAPNGVPLGTRYGRAGRNVYTLDQTAFEQLLTDVLRGSVPVPETRTPASYVDKGYWIELADRCIVGLRWSIHNGTTLQIVRSPDLNILKDKIKFHRKQP